MITLKRASRTSLLPSLTAKTAENVAFFARAWKSERSSVKECRIIEKDTVAIVHQSWGTIAKKAYFFVILPGKGVQAPSWSFRPGFHLRY